MDQKPKYKTPNTTTARRNIDSTLQDMNVGKDFLYRTPFT